MAGTDPLKERLSSLFSRTSSRTLRAAAALCREKAHKAFGASYLGFVTWLTSPRVTACQLRPLFLVKGLSGRPSVLSLGKAGRVLVVRPDEIGDVILTSPFLRELRRCVPGAWITLVVKPGTYPLVELCPYVDEVMAFDEAVRGRFLLPVWRHYRTILFSLKNLLPRRFQIALLPRRGADHYGAAKLMYASGCPVRAGYRGGTTRAGYDAFLNYGIPAPVDAHEVISNLNVLECLGGSVSDQSLELWLDQEDEAWADRFMAERAASGKTVFAFAPYARSPVRIWPLEDYVELGRRLLRSRESLIFVIGGSDARESGEALRAELGKSVINLAGAMGLRRTAAVLKRCSLYVGSDSGPMHLAAAAGTPVVEISCFPGNGDPSHPNSPSRFGPWGVRHAVLQPEEASPPCRGLCSAGRPHCIKRIAVGQVEEAVRRMLETAP